MGHKTTYKPYGDSAILIDWNAEISISISNDILGFHKKIKGLKDTNIVDVIIGYSSLTIIFKKRITEYFKEVKNLKEIYNLKDINLKQTPFIWQIPVCYDFEFGKDLHEISNVTNLEDGSAQHIVDSVQEAVEEYRTSLHHAALGEIDKARGANMLQTDLQEVYRRAFQGAGETLYVRRGYIQSAKIDEKAQTLSLVSDASAEGVTDDAIGEIIEHVIHNGGKAVFMPQDIMGEDQPIALVTRY